MNPLLLWWGAALAGAAQAGPEVWSAMYDARLAESVDRDAAAAQVIYETLLDHLAADDPAEGALQLDLARVRFDEGDVDGARVVLMQAANDPRVSVSARSWLVQLDAWERRVREIPLRSNFSSGAGPWVLGWSADRAATLDGGESGLVWHTRVRDGRDDYLLASIDADRPLNRIRLTARASSFPAHLRIIVEDRQGRRWISPVTKVPPDPPTVIDVRVQDLLPASGEPSAGRPDPAAVSVMMIQDVTAFHAGDRGFNDIIVRELELR
ncbi:MAG: tetratricopeptide repeat protein [Deltaproteobacteria bacterium]|nr:MAG: tetratricopeptide repeat protein [Deltaproteobacteria bacterium]